MCGFLYKRIELSLKVLRSRRFRALQHFLGEAVSGLQIHRRPVERDVMVIRDGTTAVAHANRLAEIEGEFRVSTIVATDGTNAVRNTIDRVIVTERFVSPSLSGLRKTGVAELLRRKNQLLIDLVKRVKTLIFFSLALTQAVV